MIAEQAPRVVCLEDLKELSFLWNFIGLHRMREWRVLKSLPASAAFIAHEYTYAGEA